LALHNLRRLPAAYSNPHGTAHSTERSFLNADSLLRYPKSQTLLRYRRIGANIFQLVALVPSA